MIVFVSVLFSLHCCSFFSFFPNKWRTDNTSLHVEQISHIPSTATGKCSLTSGWQTVFLLCRSLLVLRLADRAAQNPDCGPAPAPLHRWREVKQEEGALDDLDVLVEHYEDIFCSGALRGKSQWKDSSVTSVRSHLCPAVNLRSHHHRPESWGVVGLFLWVLHCLCFMHSFSLSVNSSLRSFMWSCESCRCKSNLADCEAVNMSRSHCLPSSI